MRLSVYKNMTIHIF
jgi:hypothetical protein